MDHYPMLSNNPVFEPPVCLRLVPETVSQQPTIWFRTDG